MTRTVILSSMPEGVEHEGRDYLVAPMVMVILSSMPEGVEHYGGGGNRQMRSSVILSSMPEGVEHVERIMSRIDVDA